MLQKMRNAARSSGAKAVAIIICVVLVLFGFGAFNLFGVSEPVAATVNGEEISVRQYMASVDRIKQNYRQQYGEQIDSAILDRLVDKPQVLDQLINRELFRQAANELDLVGSKKRFDKEIRENPNFQEDGVFDAEKLKSVLGSAGFSIGSYAQAVTEDRVINQVIEVLEGTSFVTNRERIEAAAISAQSRDIAYIEFSAADFKDESSVTEEELSSYYELNKSDFLSEESFDFEIVELEKAAFLEAASLTDEEIQELYEVETRTLQANAERRAAHILIKVDEDTAIEDARDRINELAQRISDGESFEELAKEFSEDRGSGAKGGDLEFADRGVYVSEFEQTLFGMSVGEVSDPVETQFGLHLIRLDEIKEIEQGSLEERRDELVSIHQDELAQQAFAEAGIRMDELAFESSDSLDAIVEELNLEKKIVSKINRNNREGIFSASEVRSKLFDEDVIANGFNSRVAYTNSDTAVAGRMLVQYDAEQQSLDDVKEQIKALLVREDSELAMANTVEEAKAQLLAKFDFSAVAEAFDVEWKRLESVQQTTPEIPNAIKSMAFELAIPSDNEYAIDKVSDLDTAYLLVVSRISLGDYDAITESDREKLVNELETHTKNQNLVAYIQALRDDASLDIESSVFDVSADAAE